MRRARIPFPDFFGAPPVLGNARSRKNKSIMSPLHFAAPAITHKGMVVVNTRYTKTLAVSNAALKPNPTNCAGHDRT